MEKQPAFAGVRQRLDAALTQLERAMSTPASEGPYSQIEVLYLRCEDLATVFE